MLGPVMHFNLIGILQCRSDQYFHVKLKEVKLFAHDPNVDNKTLLSQEWVFSLSQTSNLSKIPSSFTFS